MLKLKYGKYYIRNTFVIKVWRYPSTVCLETFVYCCQLFSEFVRNLDLTFFSGQDRQTSFLDLALKCLIKKDWNSKKDWNLVKKKLYKNLINRKSRCLFWPRFMKKEIQFYGTRKKAKNKRNLFTIQTLSSSAIICKLIAFPHLNFQCRYKPFKRH